MMATLKDIKYANWQPKLNKIGEISEGIDDINQCISIILSTPKSSVPHRPDFGSEIYNYVDYPVNEAIPNIIRESIDAIKEWETRIDIQNVTAEVIEEQIKIQIEWQLKDSDISVALEVTV
jgi:phage baseplate assembly protein W